MSTPAIVNEGAKGSVFYGMHFVPGVAEYQEPFQGRIFLNEQTLRKMDPTFTGCPVFVQHVDDVEQDIDVLRGEADGWVIESFFNRADGKHWAKFLVTSERGEDAIKKGFKLSNSYRADKLGPGGIWNDVTYEAEVIDGSFEHLALVPVPRYNESVVLTPEKFKEYCAERELELQRIANNSGSKENMGLQLFKRTKIDNAVDLENTMVVLPKSKKELSLIQVVNKADEHEMQHGMAHPDHLVDMGEGHKMSVKDLAEAYKKMKDTHDNDDDKEDVDEAHEHEPEATDDDSDMKNDDDGDDDGVADAVPMAKSDKAKNEEELETKKVAPQKELPEAEKPKNKKNASGKPAPKKTPEQEAEAAQRRADERARAQALRNAGAHNQPQLAAVNFSMDQVSRGKQRYGSGR